MVVIYPYKFNEFHYTFYELNYFPPYCEVAVWDISQLVNRKFADAIASERSQRPNVVVVAKWTDFIRRVLELRLQYTTSQLYVAGITPNSNGLEFLTSLIVKLLLRKPNVKFIERINGGIPLYHPVASTDGIFSNHPPSWLGKLLTFFSSLTSPAEFLVRLDYYFFRALTRWLPPATTYRLVAGEHYLVPALRQHPRTAKLVLSHSDDYSNHLIHTSSSSSRAPSKVRRAVLLEDNGPLFAGDEVQIGTKHFETSAEWYPALSSFLNQLELATGVIVEIAGHYKSAHPPTPDYYGNRNVYYGVTNTLVKHCEFVITKSSTAISYAVLNQKPVLFIYSSEANLNSVEMLDASKMASILGTKHVNIDQPPWNFAQLLQVNNAGYEAYEKACLTSAGPPRPNSQIILEDIMGITVSPGHYDYPKK